MIDSYLWFSNFSTRTRALSGRRAPVLATVALVFAAGQPALAADWNFAPRVEAGQAFKAALDELDIDWEEQLAGITGDMVAHQLGNTMRSAGNWLRQGRTTLEQDLGEYLQEELRVVPTRIEIENFIADVDQLRMDLERLEARIRRLGATGDSQ